MVYISHVIVNILTQLCSYFSWVHLITHIFKFSFPYYNEYTWAHFSIVSYLYCWSLFLTLFFPVFYLYIVILHSCYTCLSFFNEYGSTLLMLELSFLFDYGSTLLMLELSFLVDQGSPLLMLDLSFLYDSCLACISSLQLLPVVQSCSLL